MPAGNTVVMRTGSDGALRYALTRAFDHERVEPGHLTLPQDPDRTVLPGAAYRQLGEAREEYLDCGSSALRTATYLVEVFDRDHDRVAVEREKLMSQFRGPPLADPRVPYPVDPHDERAVAANAPVKWNGVYVCWCVASDPASDQQFEESEAHLLFPYVQVILSLQYYG